MDSSTNMVKKSSEVSDECEFTKTEVPPVPARALLSPQHPLLRKFQHSLKEYLLRTKTQFSGEIVELTHNNKNKEKQREEHGAKLYEMQQEIRLQNEYLEAYASEIQENLNKRRNEDDIIVNLKTKYEQKIALTRNHKANYNKLINDLDNLQALEYNIRKWTEEVEDDAHNAKLIVCRDYQLQQELCEEKKRSDMLFYQLDIEVSNRKSELVNIGDELKDQLEIINGLNQSISYANTDLEVLQNEHKRLTQVWSEVIIAIQHRDKIMHQVNEAIKKEKELIKLCTSGTEAIKKQISQELDKNEKLQLFKTRLANDFTNLKRECQKETDTLVKLEVKLEELPLWMGRTEKDLHEARKEGNQIETELRRIQLKIDKLCNKKFQLEENIIKLAQEQLITDKASEYRLKLLNNAQEQRRSLELNLSQSQNLLAETRLELDKFKGLLQKLRHDNDHLKVKLSAIQHKSDLLDSEFKTIETQIDIKMKAIDKLTRQLEIILTGSKSCEANSTQRKIKSLEKALQASEQQIQEYQQFWLMLQNHFVNLSQKRSNQLNELQVTRKQLSIIKQKSLKIDIELESSEAISQDLERDIQTFTTKIEILNEKMFKQIKRHETDESECGLKHLQLVQKLKNDEIKILELEDEAKQLQSEIERHKNLMLDKHREALSWETKYKLIEEIISWRKGETTLSGETSNMKKEIRRMKVRYSQLKRAQEKLVRDLEHCVIHREHIFIAASAKQRVEIKPTFSSTTIRQKTNDIKNKCKKVQNEISTLTEHNLTAVIKENYIITDILKKIQEDVEQKAEKNLIICTQLEESALLKHCNLEVIVRKQNRAKAYRKLCNIKLHQTYLRSDSNIQMNYLKQKEINNNITDALQTMMVKFSAQKNFFLKILQSVKN